MPSCGPLAQFPLLSGVTGDAVERWELRVFDVDIRAAYNLIMIEYADTSPEVRAVYDDIMATRQTDWINNFWKALAHDPTTLRRTWESIKQIMAAGALDALTKEMIYLAVSASNQCPYCIASHTAAARKAGMSDAMFGELMAVVGMANETNRLASGYRVDIDERFRPR
jgi:AhpD family alkylhydroperoxidase